MFSRTFNMHPLSEKLGVGLAALPNKQHASEPWGWWDKHMARWGVSLLFRRPLHFRPVKYVGTWEVSHNVDSQCNWPHNPQDELHVWSLGLSPRLQCALNIPLRRGYMPISCLKNKGCGETYTDIRVGEEWVIEWRLGPATLSKMGCHGDAFINLKTFFLKHSMGN